MKPLSLLLFFAPIMLVNSCTQSEQVYKKTYFDFDSLIHAQIKIRSVQQKMIFKMATINNQKNASSFKADSTSLANEWDAFLQLDVINKPMYKNNYIITEHADDRSNLTIRRYQSTTASPIPYIDFYYLDSFANLKQIKSTYSEKNVLNNHAHDLTLVFDEEQDNIFIQKYSIKGGQKMIFSDTVQFSIQGSVSN